MNNLTEYSNQEQKVHKLEEELQNAYAERDRHSSEGDKSENSALDDVNNTIAILQDRLEKERRLLKRLQSGSSFSCFQLENLSDAPLPKVMYIRLIDTQEGGTVYPPKGESLEDAGQASIVSKFGRAIAGKHIGDIISYKDNLSREQRFKVLNVL